MCDGRFICLAAAGYRISTTCWDSNDAVAFVAITRLSGPNCPADVRVRHIRCHRAFYVPTNGPLGATSDKDVARRDGGPIEVQKVRTITLNDLLAREGTPALTSSRWDIELSEPRALAGFDIERYRPTLVCIEAHPEVRQQLIDYFHRHHYVVVGKYLGVDAQNLYFMPDSSNHSGFRRVTR